MLNVLSGLDITANPLILLITIIVIDDEEEQKKKKKTRALGDDVGPPLSYGFENAEVIKKINTMAKQTIRNSQPDESSKQNIIHNPKVVLLIHQ